MPSVWKPLSLHQRHDGIPPLLVKHEFGPSNYQVWLTDLSYIWTESLDWRHIKRRALDFDTSIDPSEDSAQLRLFLTSIADALWQRPGTSVDLDEGNDITQLTLHTSTPLPHPLQPLQWSIVLVLATQATFALEFVSPLLHQQFTAKVEKTSLLQQLKEKDNVISRLIDKMQSDGVDLGKVFPGAISSKFGTGPTPRWAVAKSIKGLGEFDQDHWERKLAKDSGYFGDLGHILPQVFDDDGKDTGEGLQITDYGEWWKKGGRKDLQQEGATAAVLDTDAKKEREGDDEFQRQLTPPKSSAQTPRREGLTLNTVSNISSNSGEKNSHEDSSTTEGSDGEIQSFHPKPLHSPTDDAVASAPANHIKGVVSQPMDLDDNSLTSSASGIDDIPAKAQLVPKLKQKLGKIGGKGKERPPESSAVPTPKPKLGKIGGKGKLDKSDGTGSVSSQNGGIMSNKLEDPISPQLEIRDQIAALKTLEPQRRSRTVQQPPEPSPPRETSQERANRKREQLKRELESKSQAATKKKRRF